MDCSADEIRAIITVKRAWKCDVFSVSCLDAVIDDNASFEFLYLDGVREFVGLDLHSSHPLLGRRTDVGNIDRMLLISWSSGISESNQSLCRARQTTLNNHVVIVDFAIVEESTSGSNLSFFFPSNSQDPLVVLGSLVVSGLTGLSNGLTDIPCSEITHVTDLTSALGVLV
jgi:hypothetical protein